MNEATLKQVFSITSEEENPFYCPKESDFVLTKLVFAYTTAERHWNSNINGQFSA
jgi:hypothetical protein